ncbi:MAG: hypothetical protein V3V28_04725 [Polaribacter sp.]|uniref:hypothetical protein n=1 Tax=Polaribacter sp. TaxID=1920175 RepID=UPI002F35106C
MFLGTALPNLLKDTLQGFSLEDVILFISVFTSFGGLLLLIFVPNWPFRKKGISLDLAICFKVFKNTSFRKAAFDYFRTYMGIVYVLDICTHFSKNIYRITY